MGLSFIIVFFMVKPSFSSIAGGLVPSIPKSDGTLRLIAAITGTTCSAAVFIMRSTVVAEKGWTIKNLKLEKRDSAVSASMMLFLSLVIMAVSAGTLHVMGMKLNNTVEMISLFEPLGGKIAAIILILGIVGCRNFLHFPHHFNSPLAHLGLYRKREKHSLAYVPGTGTGGRPLWFRDAIY